MSKSNGIGRLSGRGNSAIVDVVQRRQADRLAKVAFIVVWLSVATVVTAVALVVTVPWLAIAVGVAAGLVLGAVTGLVVLIWPGLRLIGYWAAEITLLGLLLAGFLGLSAVMPWPAALVLLTLALGAPLAVPTSRRWLSGWCWVVISRHRLRTCFATFVRANRYGSLPWMLWARPTPAGERLWVWLRPGLSLDDLTTEGGLSRLAVGCWASEVRIHRASRRSAALLRVDITRRNPLSGVITSPLPGRVPDIDPTTGTPADTGPVVGLDLPDIPEPTPTASGERESKPARKPATRPATSGGNAKPAPAAAGVSRNGEDLSDWL